MNIIQNLVLLYLIIAACIFLSLIFLMVDFPPDKRDPNQSEKGLWRELLLVGLTWPVWIGLIIIGIIKSLRQK